jgi:ABC-type dipeptide/oligopeptide/nickel transport system permease component
VTDETIEIAILAVVLAQLLGIALGVAMAFFDFGAGRGR